MNGQGPQLGLRDRFESFRSWGLFVGRALALPMELLFRHGFGRDYIGISGLVAALGMPFWMLLLPHSDPRPLLLFDALFLVLCLAARVEGLLRRWLGYVTHSRYSGKPYILWIFPDWDEVTLKRWFEPFLAISSGVVIASLDPPLGSFLVASAVGSMVCAHVDVEAERRRIQDLVDAHLEQQNIVNGFRRARAPDEPWRETNVVSQAGFTIRKGRVK